MVIGPGSWHFEREMRLIAPGDIADQGGPLSCARVNSPFPEINLPWIKRSSPFSETFHVNRPWSWKLRAIVVSGSGWAVHVPSRRPSFARGLGTGGPSVPIRARGLWGWLADHSGSGRCVGFVELL